MSARWRLGGLACLWLATACASVPPAPVPAEQPAMLPAAPAHGYRLLAGAESDDQVALLEFTPCGAVPGASCGLRVTRTYEVGVYPADIEGPHGVIASHDGRSFYVTLAHGRPNGILQKFDVASGRKLGEVVLGMFPATVDIAPFGELLYAINFNFEDPEMQPSSLSVVDGETMTEIARPTTCRMPHGSRLNPQGTRHYSGCMMNDLLVEVDARSFEPTRFLALVAGREHAMTPAEVGAAGGHDMPGMAHRGGAGAPDVSSSCSPTWAQPSADGTHVYVACNRSNEIVDVDVARWAVARRWKTPPAPYNLAVTPDGALLVATQKGPGSTSVWRLADGQLLADLANTRKVASGVVASADSRYAFVTLEGVGGQPGTIDVIDLAALRKVATADIGKQAGGIALLP